MANTGGDAYVADIIATGDLLAWGFLVAFFLGFLYLIVLYLLGGCIIWASIIGIVLGIVFGGYMLYTTSKELTDPKDADT